MKKFLLWVWRVLLALVTLAVLTICGVFDQQIWKPVVSYPMANQHIEWRYAGYAGT